MHPIRRVGRAQLVAAARHRYRHLQQRRIAMLAQDRSSPGTGCPLSRTARAGRVAIGLLLAAATFAGRSVALAAEEPAPAAMQRMMAAAPPAAAKKSSATFGPPSDEARKSSQPKELLRYGGKSFAVWHNILVTDLEPGSRVKA